MGYFILKDAGLAEPTSLSLLKRAGSSPSGSGMIECESEEESTVSESEWASLPPTGSMARGRVVSTLGGEERLDMAVAPVAFLEDLRCHNDFLPALCDFVLVHFRDFKSMGSSRAPTGSSKDGSVG